MELQLRSYLGKKPFELAFIAHEALEGNKKVCGNHLLSTAASSTRNQCVSSITITITTSTGTTGFAVFLEVINPETAFTLPSVGTYSSSSLVF